MAIDIENRRNQELIAKKKLKSEGKASKHISSNSEKIKVESLRRKKRRMKLKAKGTGENIIEKFNASSSKSAKFARSKSKKDKSGGEKIVSKK